jgi:hypothetical protein
VAGRCVLAERVPSGLFARPETGYARVGVAGGGVCNVLRTLQPVAAEVMYAGATGQGKVHEG